MPDMTVFRVITKINPTWKTLNGLSIPARPFRALQPCLEPHISPWNHQPFSSWARLQFPPTLTHLAIDPAQPGPPGNPQPGLVSALAATYGDDSQFSILRSYQSTSSSYSEESVFLLQKVFSDSLFLDLRNTYLLLLPRSSESVSWFFSFIWEKKQGSPFSVQNVRKKVFFH